jgi:hypothetical protein
LGIYYRELSRSGAEVAFVAFGWLGIRKEEYKYKVRWAGYGPEDDQWICPESFNGLKMVEEYHQLLQLPET